MLKTKSFLYIPSQNHQQSTLEFKILTVFCKKFLWQKWEKRFHPAGSSDAWAYVKHFAKFPDFFETECWQPCSVCCPFIIFMQRSMNLKLWSKNSIFTFNYKIIHQLLAVYVSNMTRQQPVSYYYESAAALYQQWYVFWCFLISIVQNGYSHYHKTHCTLIKKIIIIIALDIGMKYSKKCELIRRLFYFKSKFLPLLS